MGNVFGAIPYKRKLDYLISAWKYLMSVVIWGIQFKATVRYHYTPFRWAQMKKNNNDKCWQGGGPVKILYKKRVYIVCFHLSEVLEQAKGWKTIRKVVAFGGEEDWPERGMKKLSGVMLIVYILMKFSVTHVYNLSKLCECSLKSWMFYCT